MKILRQIQLIVILGVFLLTSCTDNTKQDIKINLGSIEGTEIKELPKYDTTLFTAAYEVMLTQPLDHNNPAVGNFKQRILVFHSGDYNKPVVMETHGYNIWRDVEAEPCRIMKCNNVTVEHRFFGDSQPDSIPWEYLTIEQAAADHHRIIQTLKKFYKGKWMTTGISKGGQTAIFHKTLYPKDVDASIPYVAPANFAREDKRIHDFLNNKVGTAEERQKIRDFQIRLFENRDKLLPLTIEHCKEKDYTFKFGYERALEMNILEFSFAFWQWGADMKEMPGENATPKDMFDYLIKVSSFSFFEDKDVKRQQPFFYQALTQFGMYSYEVAPFKKYLKDNKDITFDFTLPEGVKHSFNPSIIMKVKNFLRTDATNMIFIYGEYDAWSATAVELGENKKCLKMVHPKGSHGTRIKHFSKENKQEIYNKMEKWMGVKINHEL